MPAAVEPMKKILIDDSVGKDGTKHNKFWMAGFDENLHVTTRWGRIGQNGQTKDHGTKMDEWDAKYEVRELARKKLRKKYREISEEDFELKSTVAKAIGTSNIMRVCEYAILEGAEIQQARQNQLMDPNNEIGIFVEVYLKKQNGNYSLLFKADGEVYGCSGSWGNRPCYFSTPLTESPELDKIKEAVSEILASGKVGA